MQRAQQGKLRRRSTEAALTEIALAAACCTNLGRAANARVRPHRAFGVLRCVRERLSRNFQEIGVNNFQDDLALHLALRTDDSSRQR